MNETPQDMAAEIEASFSHISSVSAAAISQQLGAPLLIGTVQYIITGVGNWLCTINEGAHACTRCGEACVPPPDATCTCSAETYLRVLHREGGLNAEAAMQQGLITITGDERLAFAMLRDVG